MQRLNDKGFIVVVVDKKYGRPMFRICDNEDDVEAFVELSTQLFNCNVWWFSHKIDWLRKFNLDEFMSIIPERTDEKKRKR